MDPVTRTEVIKARGGRDHALAEAQGGRLEALVEEKKAIFDDLVLELEAAEAPQEGPEAGASKVRRE
jgi:hypothetical protein